MTHFKCAAIVLSSVLAATPASGQADPVAIDLATGALRGARVRAGGVHAVQVRGLNPFCYSYGIRVTPNRASFDTGVAWEQVFGAVACRGRYESTHTGILRGVG